MGKKEFLNKKTLICGLFFKGLQEPFTVRFVRVKGHPMLKKMNGVIISLSLPLSQKILKKIFGMKIMSQTKTPCFKVLSRNQLIL